jgi:hypothetical protein
MAKTQVVINDLIRVVFALQQDQLTKLAPLLTGEHFGGDAPDILLHLPKSGGQYLNGLAILATHVVFIDDTPQCRHRNHVQQCHLCGFGSAAIVYTDDREYTRSLNITCRAWGFGFKVS